jgi:hypothetical protein
MPNTTPHDGRARSTTARALVHAHLAIQFVEQRLGVLQVGGVEALGEPVVDFGEHRERLVAAAGVAEQPGEAHGSRVAPLISHLQPGYL